MAMFSLMLHLYIHPFYPSYDRCRDSVMAMISTNHSRASPRASGRADALPPGLVGPRGQVFKIVSGERNSIVQQLGPPAVLAYATCSPRAPLSDHQWSPARLKAAKVPFHGSMGKMPALDHWAAGPLAIGPLDHWAAWPALHNAPAVRSCKW